jgi:3-dehydroquinate synthase
MTQTIQVNLGARSYEVRIGSGLIAQAGAAIAAFAPSRRVFVVTDQNVARLHRPALIASLDAAGLQNWTVTLPPGEASKSFQGLEMLCRQMLQAGIGRRDLVIAFGGGVIGDLAGLAAGLVKRGVDFVQMPTTLLAQVDSSVGGKTAIDTPEGKNFIGLIHQPRLVLADLDVLPTLPARELRCGYAEIVKVGLIQDRQFFAFCETNFGNMIDPISIPSDPGAARDTMISANEDINRAVLERAVQVAVAAKARIVEADEREAGPRALLNLGHTFAHALEAHAGYGDALMHGEAVGAGMALAFAYSAQLGFCGAEEARRVRAHLENAGLRTDLRTLPGAPYDPRRLLALMAGDKKAEAGHITLVLARAIGQAFVHKNADAAKLQSFLEGEVRQ